MQKQKELLLFKRNLQVISQNLKDLDEAKIKSASFLLPSIATPLLSVDILVTLPVRPLYSPRITLTVSSAIIRTLRREYFLRRSFDIGAQICLFTT